MSETPTDLPPPPSEAAIRLAEALIFASADPVHISAVAALIPSEDAEAVLAALGARHEHSGVRLEQIAGGWQFRTAPDLAPALTKVIAQPRRLPRVAMETLAIIAYHQPVTRGEVEEIRGATLSQATLDALLEAGLVTSKGHKEVPGRPTLWGTTPRFLQQFGLKDLRDLPRREDLLVEPISAQPTARTTQALAEASDIAAEEATTAPEAAGAAEPDTTPISPQPEAC